MLDSASHEPFQQPFSHRSLAATAGSFQLGTNTALTTRVLVVALRAVFCCTWPQVPLGLGPVVQLDVPSPSGRLERWLCCLCVGVQSSYFRQPHLAAHTLMSTGS